MPAKRTRMQTGASSCGQPSPQSHTSCRSSLVLRCGEARGGCIAPSQSVRAASSSTAACPPAEDGDRSEHEIGARKLLQVRAQDSALNAGERTELAGETVSAKVRGACVASAQSVLDASSSSAACAPTEEVVRAYHEIGARHVLEARAHLKEGSSAATYPKRAKRAHIIGGNDKDTYERLVGVMAAREIDVTNAFLGAAGVAGLAQDGRKLAVPIRLQVICWKWPRGVRRNALVRGLLPLGGPNGPWLLDRVVAVPHLGSNQTAEAIARETVSALRAKTQGGFQHLQEILAFRVTDNAADELAAGRIMGKIRSNV